VQSPGNPERLDTMEEVSHNRLKYALHYQETYTSNNILLAIWEQMATVVGCTAMRRPRQPPLPEPRDAGGRFLGRFCHSIAGDVRLVTACQLLGYSRIF